MTSAKVSDTCEATIPPKSGHLSDNSPIFLVSTGRTGTRFLAELIQVFAHDVASHHTTSYTRLLNVANNMLYLGLVPTALARVIWRGLKVPTIRAERLRYVECNPYYYNILSLVWESFPDTRVVHVIRHPRDFVQSHIKWERQRWQSRIANQLVPFWGPVSYHKQLMGLSGSTTQRVRYYSLVWRRKNQAILHAVDGDTRAITYRFEDLFASQGGTEYLKELFAWLGLISNRPIENNTLKNRRNETTTHLVGWDTTCDELVQRECSTLMERFGYEL